MERLTTIPELRERLAPVRRRGETIGLTPTMGALHEGHLTHVRRLRELADTVVVSIFVNPTQFGPDEDFDAYPRDLEGDEEKLAGLADLVWAPAVDEMYPDGDIATTVSVEGLTEVLEGEHRPGHFDGVTTVVSKLLHQVQPDLVTFGRKDFQQLAVVRRMMTDLDMAPRIVEIPIVREDDGLAMSSRNRYLDEDERAAALALSRGLRDAVEESRAARERGDRPSVEVLHDAAAGTLAAEPLATIDYVAVVDPATLRPPTDIGQDHTADAGEDGASRRLLVATAAHVGPARLIDNVVIGDEEDEERLLEATAP
ncbi:MAG: pantoate--beta-alanine ligase [Nitriliruptorales bacterium]|nr:pantoate--beta-alanine ligase [Nitriliruptorales bacterium]